MKTDILLIRPPLLIERYDAKSLSFPLGLGYLAAYLKGKFKVKILDCLAEGFEKETLIDKDFLRYGLDFKDIRRRIEILKPRIIGITCPFSLQFHEALEIAKIAKEISSKIKIILGGAHPSAVPEDVLRKPEIDFVIIGEGEISFYNLCRSILGEKTFKNIDGLAFREDDKIYISPKKEFIRDLDVIPFPAREFFPMDIYFEINRPHGLMAHSVFNTNIITSRGCPFNCIFCSIHTVWSHKYRTRSPENVLAEIKYLREKYGIRELQFEDDNLTLDKKRAKAIFSLMIKENLNIKWSAPNGIALWTLDEEMVRLMKNSGCYRLALGIESGDSYILHKVIKKPLNLEDAVKKVKILKRYRVHTSAFFVVGFPQERLENFKNTLRFATRLDTDNIHFYFPAPYPGTALYKFCKENSLLKNNFDIRKLKVSTMNVRHLYLQERTIKRLLRNTLIIFWLKKFIRNPFKNSIFILERFLKEKRRFIFYLWRLK